MVNASIFIMYVRAFVFVAENFAWNRYAESSVEFSNLLFFYPIRFEPSISITHTEIVNLEEANVKLAHYSEQNECVFLAKVTHTHLMLSAVIQWADMVKFNVYTPRNRIFWGSPTYLSLFFRVEPHSLLTLFCLAWTFSLKLTFDFKTWIFHESDPLFVRIESEFGFYHTRDRPFDRTLSTLFIVGCGLFQFSEAQYV